MYYFEIIGLCFTNAKEGDTCPKCKETKLTKHISVGSIAPFILRCNKCGLKIDGVE